MKYSDIYKSDNRNLKLEGLAAVFIKDSRDEQQPKARMFYILKDHLGSITALVDELGDVSQEYSFDAWGRRRHPDTWQCFTTEELQNFITLKIIKYLII